VGGGGGGGGGGGLPTKEAEVAGLESDKSALTKKGGKGRLIT